MDDGGDDLENMPGGPDMSRAWTSKSYSTTANLWTVWSNGAGLVIASGDSSLLLKSTGGAFAVDGSTKPTGTSNLLSLYSASPGPPTNPLYVAGQNGLIWSNSGNLATTNGAWTAETSGASTNTLYGVLVDPTGAGFAVGTNTAIKRSGSTTWSSLTGIANFAYSLWAIDTMDGYVVYAVGADSSTPAKGLIWKSTGTSYALESTGTISGLVGVWGSSASDIYAVGANGSILHSIGDGTWTAQTSPVTTQLEGIGGASADEIYIVGDGGVLLHKYSAASTTWELEPNPASVAVKDLYAVWASSSVVWAVGESGTIITK